MYIGARFLYRRRQFKVQFGSILLIIRDQDRKKVRNGQGTADMRRLGLVNKLEPQCPDISRKRDRVAH